MNNLTVEPNSQGKYEAAEAMHRQALVGFEKMHGKEHLLTLMSVHFLAHLLVNQHRYCDEGAALYERACELGMRVPVLRAADKIC
jgi:hypothetical protein